MGDRIVVMKDGLIQQVDTPVQLYDNPANMFVAGFIGTPPMNFIRGRLQRRDGAFFFNEGSFTVELPEKMYSTIHDMDGRELVFGIRPEDVRDRDHFPEVKPTRCVSARVEVIEPVGSESIWYVATPASSFIAKVDPHARAEVNKDKELVLFVEKAHLFDPTSELVIV